MPCASCAKRALRGGYGLAGVSDGRLRGANEGSPLAVPEGTAGPPRQRRRVRAPGGEERWASLRPASAASRGIRWRRRPLPPPAAGSAGGGLAAAADARTRRDRWTARAPPGAREAHRPSPYHHQLLSRAEAARRAVPDRSQRGSQRVSHLLSRVSQRPPPSQWTRRSLPSMPFMAQHEW